ncbi:MAG: hypothetical protein M3P51_10360 [Chloroflexota bacterium]|nr:hypothetical protein [Chloroflexota bacterium]
MDVYASVGFNRPRFRITGTLSGTLKGMKTSRPARFGALRYRDFRLLWLGQLFSITRNQMQFIAVNWQIY